MSLNKYDPLTGTLTTLANGQRIWLGTKAAHDAAEAAGTLPTNCLIAITDDGDVSGVVDAVEDSNMNPVTSNAVYDKMQTVVATSWAKGSAYGADFDCNDFPIGASVLVNDNTLNTPYKQNIKFDNICHVVTFPCIGTTQYIAQVAVGYYTGSTYTRMKKDGNVWTPWRKSMDQYDIRQGYCTGGHADSDDWYATFDTAFPDGNYTLSITPMSSAAACPTSWYIVGPSASGFRLYCKGTAPTSGFAYTAIRRY